MFYQGFNWGPWMAPNPINLWGLGPWVAPNPINLKGSASSGGCAPAPAGRSCSWPDLSGGWICSPSLHKKLPEGLGPCVSAKNHVNLLGLVTSLGPEPYKYIGFRGAFISPNRYCEKRCLRPTVCGQTGRAGLAGPAGFCRKLPARPIWLVWAPPV